MPKIRKRKAAVKTIDELKEDFLFYFRQLPIHKYAAQYIRRTDDTISLWKKADKNFSESIARAESEWVLDNVSVVKSREWLLERVKHEDFRERKEEEHTVSDELNKALDRLAKIIDEKK